MPCRQMLSQVRPMTRIRVRPEIKTCLREDIVARTVDLPSLLDIVSHRDGDVVSATVGEQPTAYGPGSEFIGTVGLEVDLPLSNSIILVHRDDGLLVVVESDLLVGLIEIVASAHMTRMTVVEICVELGCPRMSNK